jgi:hypothetical protein
LEQVVQLTLLESGHGEIEIAMIESDSLPLGIAGIIVMESDSLPLNLGPKCELGRRRNECFHMGKEAEGPTVVTVREIPFLSQP